MVAECLAKHWGLRAGSPRVLAWEPCSVCSACSKEFAHMVYPLVSRDELSVHQPSRQGDLERRTSQRHIAAMGHRLPIIRLSLSSSSHPSDSLLDFKLCFSVQIPDGILQSHAATVKPSHLSCISTAVTCCSILADILTFFLIICEIWCFRGTWSHLIMNIFSYIIILLYKGKKGKRRKRVFITELAKLA